MHLLSDVMSRSIDDLFLCWGTNPLKLYFLQQKHQQSNQSLPHNTSTLKCLSIGTSKTINFPFVSNWKLMGFRCPNIQTHYNEAVIYLNFGTPKNNEFSIWNKWKIYYFWVSQYLSTLGYIKRRVVRRQESVPNWSLILTAMVVLNSSSQWSMTYRLNPYMGGYVKMFLSIYKCVPSIMVLTHTETEKYH